MREPYDERDRGILRRAGYGISFQFEKPSIILYHGTLSKNVPKILEEGIMPRTAEFCHKLIEEKGEGAEEYVKKYALSRCLETTGRVSLSGSREYAIDNCRAGLESEVMLRASREGRKESEIWRDIKKEVPCSLVEVEIPREVIPRTGGGRWEGRPIGEILDSAYEVMKEIVPMTWEESKAHFQEFTFDEIPRGWIKAHYPIE